MRILIIEDELQLARHVARALSRHGHDPSERRDGASGLQAALDLSPDLIVLDLNLPSLDGFSVLARLKQAQCPARVLILTARGEVEHRVKGLKAGADDYLTKPFSMEELIARVEALGRRGATPTAADLLEVADLRMDVQHRRVTRAGQLLALSPREFDVLQVLMQEPRRVFSRTELCEAGFQEPLIHTIRSAGYTIRPPQGTGCPPG
jgi:DNA-binding response OmpR family regulator